MKNFRTASRRWLLASAAVSLLLATGCGRQTAQDQGAGESPPTVAAAPTDSPSAVLTASAEPFEALTEQASTATWPEIDRLIADSRTAATKARAALSDAGAVALDARTAEIALARKSQDRLRLALASVETYRHLVEAQDPVAAKVPIPVSLLDYAGFRYDALAQAPTVDWRAMDDAARFAGDQWRSLAPTMGSKALPGVMTESIAAMSLAAKRHDATFARSAAATELALVDLIEEQVAAQPRPS
ncbi:MAG: hypothetical protein QOC65_233 [Sphingomonadales bacterium]|nr:hypothetical protein [Sphingomonadales bacterium]